MSISILTNPDLAPNDESFYWLCKWLSKSNNPFKLIYSNTWVKSKYSNKVWYKSITELLQVIRYNLVENQYDSDNSYFKWEVCDCVAFPSDMISNNAWVKYSIDENVQLLLTNEHSIVTYIQEPNDKKPHQPTKCQTLYCISDVSDFWNWIKTKFELKYKEHPKHNVKEPTVINGKLVCPIRQKAEAAQELLNKAIHHDKIPWELFVWDNKFNEIIVFKKDTEQENAISYHGYHVSEAQFAKEYLDYRIQPSFIEKLKKQ